MITERERERRAYQNPVIETHFLAWTSSPSSFFLFSRARPYFGPKFCVLHHSPLLASMAPSPLPLQFHSSPFRSAAEEGARGIEERVQFAKQKMKEISKETAKREERKKREKWEEGSFVMFVHFR